MVPPSELLRAMEDPSMRHAAITHLPIALAIIAFILALVGALFRSWSRVPLALALLAFMALVMTARMGSVSGSEAENVVGAIAQEAREALHQHKRMGTPLYLYAIGVSLVTFTGLLNKWKLGLIFPWLAVVGGGFLLMWTSMTAHRGGQLVYVYGLGTPNPVTDTQLAIEAGEYVEPTPAYDDPRVVFFHERVRPILYNNCMGCHPTEDPDGDLSLTSIAGVLKGGSRGPAIMPGDPDESLLVRAISWEDDELFMPPDLELSDDDRAVIAQWIRDGAVWDHELPAPAESDE